MRPVTLNPRPFGLESSTLPLSNCAPICNKYQILMYHLNVLLDFSLTVKAATLLFISGRGTAISSVREGKSGFINNMVKN